MNRLPPAHRPECGSRTGYERHLEHEEYACPECLLVHAREQWAYQRARDAAVLSMFGRQESRPCGTEAAEKRHRRAGEWPCPDCTERRRAAA